MWILFLVVLLPVVIVSALALYYHTKFQRTEAYVWREGVLERYRRLTREMREADEPVRALNVDAIRSRYLSEHYGTIPVENVSRFTGIGPGTVDRLRIAGLRSLADLIGYPFENLPGIGPVKGNDLRAAVRTLRAQAEREFDSGQCRVARDCAREIEDARRRNREREADRERTLANLRKELKAIEPDAKVARGITLWGYFWNDGEYPGYGRKPDAGDEFLGWPKSWKESENEAGTAKTAGDNDLLVTMMPARGTAPMSPPPAVAAAPPLLDLTIQCGTCDARLRVTSSKRREQFRVTCPRCQTVTTVKVPDAEPKPLPVVKPLPVATPIPPLVPKPVAFAPAARAPTPASLPSNPAAATVPVALPPPPKPLNLLVPMQRVPQAPPPPVEHPELPKLRAFAAFGLMIAKADGRIAKAERAAVRESLESLFAHDLLLVWHIDPVIESAEKAIPSEEQAVALILRNTKPDERQTVYRAAEKIAFACGNRNRQEIETLDRVAAALGVEPTPVAPATPVQTPVTSTAKTVESTSVQEQSASTSACSESHTYTSAEAMKLDVFACYCTMIVELTGADSYSMRKEIKDALLNVFGSQTIINTQIDNAIRIAESLVHNVADRTEQLYKIATIDELLKLRSYTKRIDTLSRIMDSTPSNKITQCTADLEHIISDLLPTGDFRFVELLNENPGLANHDERIQERNSPDNNPPTGQTQQSIPVKHERGLPNSVVQLDSTHNSKQVSRFKNPLDSTLPATQSAKTPVWPEGMAISSKKPAKPAKPAYEPPTQSPAWPNDLFVYIHESTTSAPTNKLYIEPDDLPKLRAFAVFGLMIAKADGRISKAERAAVREFLAALFAHDSMLVRHIDPVIESAEKAIPSEEQAVALILRNTKPDERRTVYRAAEKIADACGNRNRQEIETLERVAAALGVEPAPKTVVRPEPPKPVATSIAHQSPRITPAPPPAPNHRAILEIEPGTELSVELIRRRFTMLFERADPAKAALLGPEFAAMAEKKRADVRSAAEALLAPFGAPLDPPAAPPPSDIRHNPDLDDIFGG